MHRWKRPGVDIWKRNIIPSVFISTVIVLVLALIAVVTPLLVGHSRDEAGAEEHGDAGESLELHDRLFWIDQWTDVLGDKVFSDCLEQWSE